MGARILNAAYALNRRIGIYHSKVVLTTSGTISSQTAQAAAGMVIAKTGSKTGRYTVTLDNKGASLLNAIVTIVGTDDAALTDSKGYAPRVRDIDTATGANDGTFEIQMVDKASADTEVQDSLTLLVTVITAE